MSFNEVYERYRDGRIFVGNLPKSIKSKRLDKMFRKFGTIEFIDVHDGGERGPAFAFICYDNPQVSLSTFVFI